MTLQHPSRIHHILHIVPLIVLLWCITLSFRQCAGETQCSTKRNSTLNRDTSPSAEAIARARALDPVNGGYWYKQAQEALRSQTGTQVSQAKEQAILKNFEQALALSPVTGTWWRHLGSRYALMGYREQKARVTWLAKADQAYALAEHYQPEDARILYTCARYWMWRSTLKSPAGKTHLMSPENPLIPSLPATQTEQLETSRTLFRKSLTLQTKTWEKAVAYVATLYPDPKIILSIIPPQNTRLKARVEKWMKKDGFRF